MSPVKLTKHSYKLNDAILATSWHNNESKFTKSPIYSVFVVGWTSFENFKGMFGWGELDFGMGMGDSHSRHFVGGNHISILIPERMGMFHSLIIQSLLSLGIQNPFRFQFQSRTNHTLKCRKSRKASMVAHIQDQSVILKTRHYLRKFLCHP